MDHLDDLFLSPLELMVRCLLFENLIDGVLGMTFSFVSLMLEELLLYEIFYYL